MTEVLLNDGESMDVKDDISQHPPTLSTDPDSDVAITDHTQSTSNTTPVQLNNGNTPRRSNRIKKPVVRLDL